MAGTEGAHVVLGATGGAGRALVRELVRRGHRVRAVSRSAAGPWPQAVEVTPADIRRAEDVRKACRGAAVVYHAVNVPYAQWQQILPAMADNVIAASSAADAVLYGPHANSAPDLLAIRPALRGRIASWPGSLDTPHTLTYLPDFARGLVTLGTQARAWGEVWHIPSGPPVTGRAFITEVFEALGQPPRMRRLGRGMMRLAGLFDRQIREAREVLYQFEQPFVMDTSKFERTFEATITPLRDGIRQTLAALRSGP